MTSGDSYRQWRKGEPSKLGWNDRTDPGPNSQEAPRETVSQELHRVAIEQMVSDQLNFNPLAHLPEPVINQYGSNDPPKWYEISNEMLAFLALASLFALAILVTWTLTMDYARGQERASVQKASTATTLDLCAVRLPMMAGRMVKTEGEVMFWHQAEDGGLDVYLTRELANLRETCAMPVHLPPTVPETTWRPTGGERVSVCGLMVASNNQARMNPGWRCL